MSDEPETIGELVGDGVTADDVADAERVLHRFVTAAEDADGEHVPDWLRTAHAVTGSVSQHYRARLETTETND